MAEPDAPLYAQISSRERTLITVVIITATIMVVLDSTIANVALPHMQATLGANAESVKWVLTSYILFSSIVIPLTGWLTDRFGRRALFMASIVGFTISSAACGFASSLPFMVAWRVVQGISAAFVTPLGQSIMYDSYPPSRHAFAMTVWAQGILLAQLTGPTFGGYLTDQFDWRWVFFINVPIGIAVAFAGWFVIKPGRMVRRRIDLAGFTMLTLALGSLQLLLDRGTQLDWFNSTEIVVETGLAIGAGWMFVVHLSGGENRILPRRLFRDGNFTMALIISTVVGAVMLAGSALVPPMLQQLFGYPVMLAGMASMPRGIGTFFGSIVAERLISRGADGRKLIALGMAGIAGSCWLMAQFSLLMDIRPVLVTGFIQGLAMGAMMMPMNLLAFTTLAPQLRTDGASLYNLARGIGGSIAIAVTSALLASNLQVNHAELGERLNLPSLSAMATALGQLGPVQGVAAMFDAEINRQALMIAYVDNFWLMMWAALFTVPLAILMRRQRRGERADAAEGAGAH